MRNIIKCFLGIKSGMMLPSHGRDRRFNRAFLSNRLTSKARLSARKDPWKRKGLKKYYGRKLLKFRPGASKSEGAVEQRRLLLFK
jgi:hypothetical protein